MEGVGTGVALALSVITAALNKTIRIKSLFGRAARRGAGDVITEASLLGGSQSLALDKDSVMCPAIFEL
ncbi:unnamed protein product [Pieris brassicae]|uniref:Uncharacterized protein n=1 Tax=Pieris brassicae TaxID=7116 RepID=A0A9P0X3R9_PIEBR|nr:unnamed protein product [Pieris brassicae]